MVPRLRHGILALPDHEEEGEKADSMMYQLQTMFANLQESEKQCYNPQPFCHAFKDWEGAPVDVLVQQDIHEFLTNFFQQIENKLSEMSKQHANMLKDSLGGSFCHELIAQGGRYSAREEPFYFWSLEIKDRKDLNKALEHTLEGEAVEYTWEEKQKDGTEKKTKVETTKRMSVKTLPRHLFLHLKRFEMDLETMQQVKINDKFEFPQELDMFPYTVEGRAEAEAKAAAEAGNSGVKSSDVPPHDDVDTGEDDAGVSVGEDVEDEDKPKGPVIPDKKPAEHYKYELAGVVVHMGVANSGHYYSYIRDRQTHGKSSQWFEFNDELVCPFDASQLEAECFGGEETFEGYGSRMGGTGAGGVSYGSGMSYGGGQNYSRAKIRNAFVLVYDRVPSTASLATAGSGRSSSASVGAAALSTPRKSSILAARAPVPEAIFKEIWKANSDFWQRANVHDASYLEFMTSFVSEGNIRAFSRLLGSARLLEMGTRFLLTVCRSFSRRDAQLVENLTATLCRMYGENLEACNAFLCNIISSANLTAVEELLLEFETPLVRRCIATLCLKCMRVSISASPITTL